MDEALGSPLDRLATPSWADHHEAVVRAACQSSESSVVVAENDGEILGFVGYRVHATSGGMSEYDEVEVIAVDPACRGRGVGRGLLDHAVGELRDAGVPVIMLETGGDEGHMPARALYESAGFRRLPTAQYWLSGSRARLAPGSGLTRGSVVPSRLVVAHRLAPPPVASPAGQATAVTGLRRTVPPIAFHAGDACWRAALRAAADHAPCAHRHLDDRLGG